MTDATVAQEFRRIRRTLQVIIVLLAVLVGSVLTYLVTATALDPVSLALVAVAGVVFVVAPGLVVYQVLEDLGGTPQ